MWQLQPYVKPMRPGNHWWVGQEQAETYSLNCSTMNRQLPYLAKRADGSGHLPMPVAGFTRDSRRTEHPQWLGSGGTLFRLPPQFRLGISRDLAQLCRTQHVMIVQGVWFWPKLKSRRTFHLPLRSLVATTATDLALVSIPSERLWEEAPVHFEIEGVIKKGIRGYPLGRTCWLVMVQMVGRQAVPSLSLLSIPQYHHRQI